MFNKLLSRLKLTLSRDPALVVLILLAAAYFLLYYVTDPVRPANTFAWLGLHETIQYPKGWWGNFDQGQYLKIANTVADFNFGNFHNTYTYGLGYPIVAVPFIWLGINSDPFLLFNLFAFVFAVFAVYRTAQILISPVAGWLAGFGLAFATPLIHYTDQPWNSTVCLVAVSGILLVVSAKKPTKVHAIIVGLLIGWAFAARYIDAVWLGLLGAASLYRGSFKGFPKQIGFMIIGLSILVIPVFYTHYKVFGSPFRTPYVNHLGLNGVKISDQQAGAYKLGRIPKAALGMFVSPRLAGQPDNDRGLLVDMFWAIAAIPGAFILFRQSSRKVFFATLFAVTIVAGLFYLSFRASTPYSIKYGVLHYFKMFWPGTVLFATAFFWNYLKLLPKKPGRKN